MILEPSSIDPEIVGMLREDAASASPRTARDRVAARLLSAGVAVAGGATTVAGTAAAMQGPAVAGAATLLSGAGLLKTFVIGAVLGAGTGLGAHAAYRVTSTERAPVFAPALEISVRSAPPPPVIDLPAREPAVVQVVVKPTAKEVRAPDDSALSRRGARLERARGVAASPPPELPTVGVLAPTLEARLAEQQALLDRARLALREGDAPRALATIEQHRARFATTAFGEERAALEIRALIATGNATLAQARLTDFERRFGSSLHLSSLRRAVAEARARATPVTDRESSPQSVDSESAVR